MSRISPNRIHHHPIGSSVVIYNPVVGAGYKIFLYPPSVEDVLSAAKRTRLLRVERGWSASEAARKIVELSVALDRPIELSQQAVSKFETGKGKSIPVWTRLLEMAVEFDKLSPADRVSYLSVRRNHLKPTLPLGRRMQFVSYMMALPGEELLAEMFESMLLSMPSVSREELPRELAKLLPSALEQMRFSMFEMIVPQSDPQPMPIEDLGAESLGTQRAARTG